MTNSVTWRARLIEPGRDALEYKAPSYEACKAWARGALSAREARPRCVLVLVAPHGARANYAVRGGGRDAVSFVQLREGA